MEGKPLELWRVAECTELSEDAIATMLVRETEKRPGGVATFRYPPLPCAAITNLTQWSDKEPTETELPTS